MTLNSVGISLLQSTHQSSMYTFHLYYFFLVHTGDGIYILGEGCREDTSFLPELDVEIRFHKMSRS